MLAALGGPRASSSPRGRWTRSSRWRLPARRARRDLARPARVRIRRAADAGHRAALRDRAGASSTRASRSHLAQGGRARARRRRARSGACSSPPRSRWRSCCSPAACSSSRRSPAARRGSRLPHRDVLVGGFSPPAASYDTREKYTRSTTGARARRGDPGRSSAALASVLAARRRATATWLPDRRAPGPHRPPRHGHVVPGGERRLLRRDRDAIVRAAASSRRSHAVGHRQRDVRPAVLSG
jgi:hypothetical protein